MNEVETKYASQVWRNLKYIIAQCEKQLLILLAEPTAPKAWPRINWLRQRLAERTMLIKDEPDSEIRFQEEPVKVAFEDTGMGLNDRLFGPSGDQSKPVLQTSLRRTLLSCLVKPQSPISPEQVTEQLKKLKVKREKGRFVSRPLPEALQEVQLQMPNV